MILKNIFIFSKQGKQSEINLDNPKGASFKENHHLVDCFTERQNTLSVYGSQFIMVNPPNH
jgi:hypothetical protein